VLCLALWCTQAALASRAAARGGWNRARVRGCVRAAMCVCLSACALRGRVRSGSPRMLRRWHVGAAPRNHTRHTPAQVLSLRGGSQEALAAFRAKLPPELQAEYDKVHAPLPNDPPSWAPGW